MAMPPPPKPSQASELAKDGTARRPSDSAAISLSATMVIHGAPNDSARITSNTVAMIQDDRVSTDGTPMRSCIIRPWLPRRREGDAIVTGVPPAFDTLKQSAATVRGDGKRRYHRRWSLGLPIGRGIYRFPVRAGDRGGGDSPVQNADERLQRHATKVRNRARAPGRCCGQPPNKAVEHLWIGGRGLGIFGGECRGWDEGEPSNARSFARRHCGRAALERRLDRAKNR